MSSTTKSQSNLTELAFAVLLLAVLALLTANILIFLIAARHNDDVCRSITIAAAKAAVEGDDSKASYGAAWRELTQNAYGGFFIDAPKIASYSDVTEGTKRRIKVQTSSFVRLPVRNLVAANDLKSLLTLKRTYIVEIGLSPEKQKSDSERKE